MGHKESKSAKGRSSDAASSLQDAMTANDKKLKERMTLFHEELKNHLSDEFIRLDNEGEELDHRMIQLQEERAQKDKTLFKHMEQADVRKYFSPILINEEEDKNQNDKEQEFSDLLGSLEYEKKQLDDRKSEIMHLLSEIDEIINDIE